MADDVIHGVPTRGGNELDRIVFTLFDLFFFVACLLSSDVHHSFNSHRCEKLARKCFTVDWSCCLVIGCSCYALDAFRLLRHETFWLVVYMFGFAVVGILFLYFSSTSPSLWNKSRGSNCRFQWSFYALHLWHIADIQQLDSCRSSQNATKRSTCRVFRCGLRGSLCRKGR